MAAVAGGVLEDLGQERSGEAVPGGDPANRLAKLKLPVGGLQSACGTHRQLLLPGAGLGVVADRLEPLGEQGVGDGVYHLDALVHGQSGSVDAGLHRDQAVIVAAEQGELVLEGDLQAEAVIGEPRHLLFEEVPGTVLPGGVVQHHVGQHLGVIGDVG